MGKFVFGRSRARGGRNTSNTDVKQKGKAVKEAEKEFTK
jgi:hypothetical protein